MGRRGYGKGIGQEWHRLFGQIERMAVLCDINENNIAWKHDEGLQLSVSLKAGHLPSVSLSFLVCNRTSNIPLFRRIKRGHSFIYLFILYLSNNLDARYCAGGWLCKIDIKLVST